MNKKSARAILRCSDRVQKAVEACLEQLPQAERESAEAYWAGHILSITKGNGYGAMPVDTADFVLNDE